MFQQLDDSPPKIDPRLIDILSNPIRVRFIEMLSDRVSLTPVEALKMLGGSEVGLSNFAYHARILHDYKLVELARVPDREGGLAYRLTPRAFIEDTIWHTMPDGLKPVAWTATLQALLQHSVAALDAGTVEKRDSQLNLLPLALDEQGWQKVVGALAESLMLVEEAHRESVERALKSPQGEAGLSPAIVALTAFEASPTEASTGIASQ
jgi:DNA-binding transcriptional ArsR family regulator